MRAVCHDESKCVGCGACTAICPAKCIDLRDNVFGEEIAYVHEEECRNCGLCTAACQALSCVQCINPLECYAAYRNEDVKRLDSASGGVGAALMECFVASGGIVYGCRYNTDFLPEICRVTKQNETDIEKCKGSIYVQASMGNAYEDIAADLKTGKKVLFVGMPCQVAAVDSYLSAKQISKETLYTCDILCHGVVSKSLFADEIDNILKKKKCAKSDLQNITFRSNRPHSTFWLKLYAKDHCIYARPAYQQYYFYSFLTGLSLRENCYQCVFSRQERVGDISIGDFIGLGTNPSYPRFTGKQKNASIVLLNHKERGRYLLSICRNCLDMFERPLEEALQKCPALINPVQKPQFAERFKTQCVKDGFAAAARRELRWKIVCNSVLFVINFVLSRVGKKPVKYK